jgi:hypothetical protein
MRRQGLSAEVTAEVTTQVTTQVERPFVVAPGHQVGTAGAPLDPNGSKAGQAPVVACAGALRLAPRKRGEADTLRVSGEGLLLQRRAIASFSALAPHPRPGYAGARGYECLSLRDPLTASRPEGHA